MNHKTQLFFLHFAGGNIYSFQFLKEYFNDEYEFIPLELPGRGKRVEEPLLGNRKSAIQDYFNQIQQVRNKTNYIVYGHSMGATIGLYLTAKLEAIGDPPLQLVVSGSAGPDTGKNKKRFLMSDIEFKEELKSLGGTPKELLENDDLYEYFAPIMRSDFKIIEKQQVIDQIKCVINTPISAIMGSEEESVSEINNWTSFTNGAFTENILKGNHFFIYNHPKQLSEIIKQSYNAAKVY